MNDEARSRRARRNDLEVTRVYEPGPDSEERIRRAISILRGVELAAPPPPTRDEPRDTSTTSTAPTSKLLLTAEQAADALSVSRGRVYELIASGRLKSVKLGKSRRISRRALEELIADLERGS
jgi:excisionase family DNA binding protein